MPTFSVYRIEISSDTVRNFSCAALYLRQGGRAPPHCTSEWIHVLRLLCLHPEEASLCQIRRSRWPLGGTSPSNHFTMKSRIQRGTEIIFRMRRFCILHDAIGM